MFFLNYLLSFLIVFVILNMFFTLTVLLMWFTLQGHRSRDVFAANHKTEYNNKIIYNKNEFSLQELCWYWPAEGSVLTLVRCLQCVCRRTDWLQLCCSSTHADRQAATMLLQEKRTDEAQQDFLHAHLSNKPTKHFCTYSKNIIGV